MENKTEQVQDGQYGVLDLLYEQYQETADGDSFLNRLLFHQLYIELRKLEPDVCDQILTLVCALCGDYEKDAYVAGIKTGMRMLHELGL